MHLKTVLKDQSYELEERYKSVKRIVEREFLKTYRELMESKLIKVSTGIRRAGKSFSVYLLLRNENFAYANFDEKLLLSASENEILSSLFEIYGDVRVFFFDEIQNMDGWELFVNKLHRRGYNVFITGSNARLLARELADRLTGRHISMMVYPFSFTEFLKAMDFREDPETTRGKGLIKKYLDEYCRFGGFPEVVVEKENPRIYIKTLFNDIIERDIISRYSIREETTFREMAYYLLSNAGRYITYNSLKNYFNLGSDHTAKNYISYLQNSYLFFILNKFDFSLKVMGRSPRKIYAVDPGFFTYAHRFSSDKGIIMENMVAVELLRRRDYNFRDWKIYYWKDHQGREVDFVIKERTRVKELIQVTYASGKDEIERREIKALEKAGEEMKCKKKTVITWDYEEEGEIKFIPLWKWLFGANST